MTAPNAPDSIILPGVFSDKVDKLYPDFPEAKLSGNSSIYFLYDVENQSHGSTPKNVKRVESTSLEEIGFAPRSFKGHSKEGIILFETFNYGGTSQGYIKSVDDITNKFPVGSEAGVSSFIVISGKWELCTQVQGVSPIVIDGKTQFGPGTNVSFNTSGNEGANYIIKSIKRVYALSPIAPDSIILQGVFSDEVDKLYPDFSKAKLSGNSSIYFLYDVENLSRGSTPNIPKIVESTSLEEIGFTPKSLKGHSKEGIILFETFNYGGTSQGYINSVDDITDKFPVSSEAGVSSFIVISGMWELCTQVQGVSPIVIDGKTEFGPGTNVNFNTSGNEGANGIIKSIKKVNAPAPILNAPDSIILRGISQKSYNDQVNRIRQDYSMAKLSGNRSIYFLYDVENLSYGRIPKNVKRVESTSFEEIGFTPRSLKGHYKEGLILFSTFNYGGNSQSFADNEDDITNMFPLGSSDNGVSSFIVISGKWELCTQVQGVSPIVIDGKTQFGPGTNVSFNISAEGANNIIRSIKRVSAV